MGTRIATSLKFLRNSIIRLTVAYIVLLTITLLPGVSVESGLFARWVVALIFVILSAVVRPVLLAFTLPLSIMTGGLFLFVIDGVLLWITALLTHLNIRGFGWAILAAIAVGITNIWVEAAFTRLGWLEREGEYDPGKTEAPGPLLRILLLLGLLVGLIFSLSMAFQAMLALATITRNPVLVLGGACFILLFVSYGVAWLVAEGLDMRRRVLFGAVVGVLATGLVTAVMAAFVLRPLDVTPASPQPGAEIRYWDLPTGSRIAYRHFPAHGGPEGAPILFLHGGPGWAVFESDLEFYAQFAQDGFDVYLYDRVGTGLSERLEDVGDYGLERDLEDLDAIRRMLGADRLTLIGHGAGAELAMRYMSRFPERVDRVVLHSPTPMWSDSEFTYNFTVTGSPWGLVPVFEPRALFASALVLYGPEAADRLVPEAEIGAWFTRSFAPSALLCARDKDRAPRIENEDFNYYVHMQTGWNMDDPPDPRPGLERNVTPVILLTSECDFVPWDVVRQYQDTLPNLKVYYFENAGHMINLTRSEDMAQVIRAFLLRGEPPPMEPYPDPKSPRPGLQIRSLLP